MSTHLDDRQRAMLAEMGITAWAREPARPAPQPGKQGAPIAKTARHAATTAPTTAPAAAPRPTPTPARPNHDGVAVELTALAPGIDQMDWSELRTAIAQCRACGLYMGRSQSVFGAGSPHADWMVVGDAPREEEDRSGEPFVGAMGQLLDNMMAAVGRSRQAVDAGEGVFITNVVKCHPPDSRNPESGEITQCEHHLRRQVALVQPKVILAMGRFAIQSLLASTEPLGRLRGRVHDYHGVPVVVTYHPAYLLHEPIKKADAWQDLCLAMGVTTSDTPPAQS